MPISAVTGLLGLVSLHHDIWGQDQLEAERPKELVGSSSETPAAALGLGAVVGGGVWV